VEKIQPHLLFNKVFAKKLWELWAGLISLGTGIIGALLCILYWIVVLDKAGKFLDWLNDSWILKKELKNKIQLDATYYFIMLMLGSTCFGHH